MADIRQPRTWPQIVGERIRALRSEAGWSLEDLAEAIDRTEAEARIIEEGQVDLSVNMLLEVAFALGVESVVLTDGLLPLPRGPRPWLDTPSPSPG